MCLLLETVKIADGSPCNLDYHQQRVNRACLSLFRSDRPPDLRSVPLPEDLPSGILKWRIVYGKEITESTVESYHPKKITSVKLLVNNGIDYRFKYADRALFLEMLERKGDCDDILVVRNGMLTDISFANAALFDGKAWFTPKMPLLAGTCRARLLDHGRIREMDIRLSDLGRFTTVSVINAMLDLGEMTFPVSGIIP